MIGHMKPAQIKTKRMKLMARRDLIDVEIKQLQEDCPHTGAIKAHRCDTSNFDPHADRYWTEFHCVSCDKKWSEEGLK